MCMAPLQPVSPAAVLWLICRNGVKRLESFCLYFGAHCYPAGGEAWQTGAHQLPLGMVTPHVSIRSAQREGRWLGWSRKSPDDTHHVYEAVEQ